MALNTNDLNALIIPESVFVKEIYTNTPAWRIRHGGYNFVELVEQVVSLGGSGTFSTMTNNGNSTYTFTPASGVAVLIDTRAASNSVTVSPANIPSTNNNVQTALEYLHNNVANTQAALGITFTPTEGITPTFGSFTGWTITDNLTLKPILQELEIYTQDAVHAASNGLTKVSGTSGSSETLVKLGGTLTENTQLRVGTFDFDIRRSAAGLKFKAANNSSTLFGVGQSAFYTEGIVGTTLAISGVRNTGTDVVPFMSKEDSATNRSQLVELGISSVTMANATSTILSQSVAVTDTGVVSIFNNNSAGSEAVYTTLTSSKFRIGTTTATAPATTAYYDLPVIDGTVGQTLTTDGSGTVSWAAGGGGGGLSNEFVTMQEFLSIEPIINRDGDSFFIVPTSLNGYELEGYQWSQFVAGSGTFDINLEINGSLVAGGTSNVGITVLSGSITFATVTLSAGDRVRVNVSNLSGLGGSGLAVAMELLKP